MLSNAKELLFGLCEGNAPPNNSMDVRQKQRLFITALLSSHVPVAGFCPRHLSRSALSGEKPTAQFMGLE
ncbi:MAG TPA: hypothetical protein VGD05_05115 [Pyrinomonadaceae bacterium]